MDAFYIDKDAAACLCGSDAVKNVDHFSHFVVSSIRFVSLSLFRFRFVRVWLFRFFGGALCCGDGTADYEDIARVCHVVEDERGDHAPLA